MATVTLQKFDGGSGSSIDLNDAVFGAEVNERVVRAAYNQFMAGQRAGTAAAKARGQVSGGGRKPYKQKGTGRARQGSIRAPHYRGGAVIFGPTPRDHSYKLNRKERRAALIGALSSHASQGDLTVVEHLDLPEPKTQLFVATLKKLGLDDARRLLVVAATAADTTNLLLAARNVQHVKIVNANNLNIFDLLTTYKLLLTRAAAEEITANFSANEEAAE